MPIVIPRTGPIYPEIRSTYTQEQKNKAWEYIIAQNADKILKKEAASG